MQACLVHLCCLAQVLAEGETCWTRRSCGYVMYELAERALDESISGKLKDYISQVCIYVSAFDNDFTIFDLPEALVFLKKAM